jgi:hypothetical protein
VATKKRILVIPSNSSVIPMLTDSLTNMAEVARNKGVSRLNHERFFTGCPSW